MIHVLAEAVRNINIAAEDKKLCVIANKGTIANQAVGAAGSRFVIMEEIW